MRNKYESPFFAAATQGRRVTLLRSSYAGQASHPSSQQLRRAGERRKGSALILAVVLTSLLAMVGVMFVMLSRIDSMSTSAVAENKDLNFAVDSVIAKIKQTLAEDVPGVRNHRFPLVEFPRPVTPEYQDYPLNDASPGLDNIPGNGDDIPLGPGLDGQLGTADDWHLGPGPDGFYYTKDDLTYYPGPDGVYNTPDDTPYHPGRDGTYGTGDEILMPAFREQDPWLASLEPQVFDNGTIVYYYWPHITDLYGDYFGLLKGDVWNRLNYYFDPDYKDNIFQWTQGNLESIWYHAGPFNVTAKVINPGRPVDDIIINAGDWSRPAHLLPFGSRADADGDGVADSRWIILPDKTSSKGEPVYAAIRIVDNGGMLNVNTGLMNTTAPEFLDPSHPLFPQFFALFDPNTVDGSKQTQVNLAMLSQRGSNGTLREAAGDLHNFRCNGQLPLPTLQEYLTNVVWRYARVPSPYTPYDISDELKMRNRYILNYNLMTSRIEGLWKNAYDVGPRVPFPTTTYPFIMWPDVASYLVDPCDYDFRHISTTFNLDRIIDPTGRKMFNVNSSLPAIDPNARLLFDRMTMTGSIAPTAALAQFCANVADFADEDTDNVSVVSFGGRNYYGFEAQPFITELGMKIDRYPERSERNFYAVELHNPFNKSINLDEFVLMVDSPSDTNDPNTAVCTIPLVGTIGPYKSLVIANDPAAFLIAADANNPPVIKAPCLRFFGDWRVPDKLKPVDDRRDRPDRLEPGVYIGWTESYSLYLARKVKRDGEYIYIDGQPTSKDWAPAGVERYLGRDIRDWHIVYQNLDLVTNINTLGSPNPTIINYPAIYRFSLYLPDSDYVLSNGRRQRLITVGDIPQILTIGPTPYPARTVGNQLYDQQLRRSPPENAVRFNLQNPLYANIFQYLTVFDPSKDGIDNDGDIIHDDGDCHRPHLLPGDETKVPGKININTAPWFVIAQLPWMTNELARAIVAYRDKLNLTAIGGPDYFLAGAPDSRYLATGKFVPETPGFRSIGELNFVTADNDFTDNLHYAIQRNEPDGENVLGFPDLTSDNLVDDFEERDVIFSRISNLATVRSDVFTAYILVRIGKDGPQKRVVAILDRSDVYPNQNYDPVNDPSPTVGDVKLRALQSVPDPR